MDVSKVTFVGGPDIGKFKQTTSITQVKLGLDNVYVEFDKKDGPNRWPDIQSPNFAHGEYLQYSIGLVLEYSGQLYGSAPIELWYGLPGSGGQIQKQNVDGSGLNQIRKNWFYDSRWDPLHLLNPIPGTTIGLFVCAGDARNNFCPLEERSNIVSFSLPQSGVEQTFTFDTETPPPSGPTNPTTEIQLLTDIRDVLRHMDDTLMKIYNK